MTKIHTIIFFILLIANQANAAITILLGTSTAGKTSIAKALSAMEFNEPVKLLSFDDFFIPNIKWDGVCAIAWSPSCLFTGDFSTVITPELIEEARKKAIMDMIAAAKESYRLGEQVILDAGIRDKDTFELFEQELSDVNIKWILVYYPVEELISRVVNRNKSQEREEQRSIVQALHHFCIMYEPCTDSKRYCGKIDENAIEAAFRTARDAVQQQEPSWPSLDAIVAAIQKAVCPEDINKLQSRYTKRFGIKPTSIQHIYKFDLLINTADVTPEEGAKQIWNVISK